MGVLSEVRAKWCFGNQATAEGGAVIGSTGTGVLTYVNGLAREQSFYLETSASATCSYQILTARTLTGPTIVLTSNTMSSNVLELVQLTGPLAYVAPRIKTLTSTAANVNVTVELYGN